MIAIIEVLSESLCLILGVAIFIWLVGIRVSCPNCSARFYSKKGFCPECGFDLANPLPPPFDGLPGEEGFSSASQAFHFQSKKDRPEIPSDDPPKSDQ